MITLGQNTGEMCYAEFGMTKGAASTGEEWETCLLVPNCKPKREPNSCALVLLLVMVVAAVVLAGACCTCAVPRQGVRTLQRADQCVCVVQTALTRTETGSAASRVMSATLGPLSLAAAACYPLCLLQWLQTLRTACFAPATTCVDAVRTIAPIAPTHTTTTTTTTTVCMQLGLGVREHGARARPSGQRRDLPRRRRDGLL